MYLVVTCRVSNCALTILASLSTVWLHHHVKTIILIQILYFYMVSENAWTIIFVLVLALELSLHVFLLVVYCICSECNDIIAHVLFAYCPCTIYILFCVLMPYVKEHMECFSPLQGQVCFLCRSSHVNQLPDETCIMSSHRPNTVYGLMFALQLNLTWVNLNE